jgi:Uma2 family endonuclease
MSIVDAGKKLVTADELLKMGDIGRCELIYGELIMMSPAGFSHGEIAMRLGMHLARFVEDHDLGTVLAAETGYRIESEPDLVRAPDASFIRKDRMPKTKWRKYFPGVPDLAVEVLSAADTKREVAEKVNMWLVNGTVSVWVADPEGETVVIHRLNAKAVKLSIKDRIENDPALPGFTLELKRIFRRP